jgi:succinate dehydrogenase hydrophobic anchor subunit
MFQNSHQQSGIEMTRIMKALWLATLLNGTAVASVLTYSLGNVPFVEFKEPLKWFALGTLLSAMAFSFAYLVGMNVAGEDHSKRETSRGVVRLMLGVPMSGLLALVAFVKGVMAAYSQFAG